MIEIPGRRAPARLDQYVAVPGTDCRWRAIGNGGSRARRRRTRVGGGWLRRERRASCRDPDGQNAKKLGAVQARQSPAPMQTFSQHGAPNQEVVTGKFELDLGSTHLPLNTFSHLLHLAKTAVSLCGDCGQALEAEEPVLGNRPGTTHA